ncbi:MAG: hypothetical protein NXH73_12510 [Flavobacteriaceae bacterium]|nr:hypothetical protein [Flavobacteriaceae bacterium]
METLFSRFILDDVLDNPATTRKNKLLNSLFCKGSPQWSINACQSSKIINRATKY